MTKKEAAEILKDVVPLSGECTCPLCMRVWDQQMEALDMGARALEILYNRERGGFHDVDEFYEE